jgi:7-keto-8-aminopelargonate synthetase-like enzyme
MALLESPVGAEIRIDGRRYVNFAGSSYLGLAGHPRIIAAGIAALEKWGAGNPIPSSHGVGFASHQHVESVAASFFGEHAIFLASGYLVGLAGLAAVEGEYDQIFFDELSHYSLIDAIRASGRPAHPFSHGDPDSLAQHLDQQLQRNNRPLVISDGMFSTRGEIAPATAYQRIIARHDGLLFLDESHSFGALGHFGRGLLEEQGLKSHRLIRGGSLGKAFGTTGALLLGPAGAIDRVRLSAVGKGASQGSASTAAMAGVSLSHVREHPELVEMLRNNTRILKEAIADLGLAVVPGSAPVISLDPPAGMTAIAARALLMDRGIHVYASNYLGSGPVGVLRCAIFADHRPEHLECLRDVLADIY